MLPLIFRNKYYRRITYSVYNYICQYHRFLGIDEIDAPIGMVYIPFQMGTINKQSGKRRNENNLI